MQSCILTITKLHEVITYLLSHLEAVQFHYSGLYLLFASNLQKEETFICFNVSIFKWRNVLIIIV